MTDNQRCFVAFVLSMWVSTRQLAGKPTIAEAEASLAPIDKRRSQSLIFYLILIGAVVRDVHTASSAR